MATLLIGYYAAINLYLFALMGIDKKRALEKKWRIKEMTLFIAALLGGGLGGFFGMFFFHHKSKKPLFYVVFCAGILIHVALVYIISLRGVF